MKSSVLLLPQVLYYSTLPLPTSLLLACYYDNLDVVKYLLTVHNADVQAIEDKGKSRLHLAVHKSIYREEVARYDMVQYLLENYPEYGAQVNANNDFGESPLHVAVGGGLPLVSVQD